MFYLFLPFHFYLVYLNLEVKLKSSLSNQIQKTNNEIIRVKTEIKSIEEKLNVQHDALYGYLEMKLHISSI